MPIYEYVCPDNHYFEQVFPTMRTAEMHLKDHPCECGLLATRTFEHTRISTPGDSVQKRHRLVDDRKTRQAKRVEAMVADGKMTNDQAWKLSQIGKRGNSPYQTDPKKHKTEARQETETEVEYIAKDTGKKSGKK
jgi:hypothetical protein